MPDRPGACMMVTVERRLTNRHPEATMIPSNYTLETITKARIADRVAEAAQSHLARAASQGGQRPAPAHTTSADTFSWLRQLATRLTGARA
jgi:hypothetical protein